MNRITVYEPLKGELDAVAQPVELIDEAGKRLGHFVPARITSPGEECPYSLEGLEHMQSEVGGRPLKEIWTSLGAK
ncbi:MAG: hypothetical protein HUU20_13965 [Pirellulales bacterium]|nr:hypothetical protein [Pirellulales bacterium]